MAHETQMAFVERVKALYPAHFNGVRVLEIGSYDVNGSVRPLFTDCDYTGVDVGPGNGVDVVCPKGFAVAWREGNENPLRKAFDTVISCECLEHDEHWRDTLYEAVQALKRGGLLVLTVAGSRRPEHGTRRTNPQDSLLQTDYYYGLDEADLRGALPLDDFLVYEFSLNEWPSDTYGWFLKK